VINVSQLLPKFYIYQNAISNLLNAHTKSAKFKRKNCNPLKILFHECVCWLALQESSLLYLFPLVLTGNDMTATKRKKKMEMADFFPFFVFCALWVGGTLSVHILTI